MKVELKTGAHVRIAIDADYPHPRYRLLTRLGHAIGPRLQKELPMPVGPTRCLTYVQAVAAFEIWETYMERQAACSGKGTR